MATKAEITLHCNQCGHAWNQNAKGPPVRCGKCNSRDWDRPKRRPLQEHLDGVHNAALDVQISELREVIKLIEGRIAELVAKKK